MTKCYDIPRIRITVEGGVIQAVENVPEGVIVEVWDFDTEGAPEGDERIRKNEDGDRYYYAAYRGWEK